MLNLFCHVQRDRKSVLIKQVLRDRHSHIFRNIAIFTSHHNSFSKGRLDSKARQGQNLEIIYRPFSLNNTYEKILSRMLSSWIQQCIIKTKHDDQVGCVTEKHSLYKFCRAIMQYGILIEWKLKNHKIISIATENALSETEFPLTIKTLNKLCKENVSTKSRLYIASPQLTSNTRGQHFLNQIPKA